MIINKKIRIIGGASETLVEVLDEKYLKELDKTGAVIEKGIAIYYIRDEMKETFAIPVNNNSLINKTRMPYLKYNDAYYPFAETEELISVYKMIRKLSRTPDALDIRNIESLGKKIKFIYRNAFFEDIASREYITPTLRKISFYLWIICGVLNTLQGRELLYTINYLCAILQLDVITLGQIIMASSISKEKKEFLINNIKANGINPQVIDYNADVRLYTIFEDEEKPLEVISRLH